MEWSLSTSLSVCSYLEPCLTSKMEHFVKLVNSAYVFMCILLSILFMCILKLLVCTVTESLLKKFSLRIANIAIGKIGIIYQDIANKYIYLLSYTCRMFLWTTLHHDFYI